MRRPQNLINPNPFYSLRIGTFGKIILITALLTSLNHRIPKLNGKLYRERDKRLCLTRIQAMGLSERETWILLLFIFSMLYNRSKQSRSAPPSPGEIFCFRSGTDLFRVARSEIQHLEADDKYVRMHVAGRSQPYMLLGSLSEWIHKLGGEPFCRCHRSHAIHFEHVEALRKCGRRSQIVLKSGKTVPVSKKYVKGLVEKLSGED